MPLSLPLLLLLLYSSNSCLALVTGAGPRGAGADQRAGAGKSELLLKGAEVTRGKQQRTELGNGVDVRAEAGEGVQTEARSGPGTGRGGVEWECPSLLLPPSLTCSCDLAHTLRCDGQLYDRREGGRREGGRRERRRKEVLLELLQQVSSLPPSHHVALLDISARDLTRLPGRIFQDLTIEGLVVSSGQLANLSTKAFHGLEDQLTALGLPGNKLVTVPVQALSPLLLLSRLDLSGNSLPSLSSLPSLPDLEFLSLASNSIRVLAAGVFQAVPHLRTLQLGGNLLSSSALYHYNLQHLSYLSSLDLSSNRLSGPLHPPALDLFPPNLRHLDLSANSVTSLAARTFSSLTGLTSLTLEGNSLEEVEGGAFLGLLSLSSLDLSHNSILTLATDSLAGLPSLTLLSLAHNHLQALAPSLLPGSPLLHSLLLMDNDITTLAEGALDSLHGLTELNLAGNPLSCDCHISYLHSWLSAPRPTLLSNFTLSSALCALPPPLSNAPLASLPSPPSCSEELEDSQMDSPRNDYYEYYSEPSDTFLSSAELQLASSTFLASTGELTLVWRVEAAALPYTCGQLHVFSETPSLGPVPVLQQALHCDSASQAEPQLLPVSIVLGAHKLSLDLPHIFCISLLQDSSVIPGCSGALSLAGEVTQVHSLESQASLSHLSANVSSDGTTVSLLLDTRVPPSLADSCLLHLSLSSPTSPPLPIASTTTNCSTSLHTFLDLPPHTYYNVCASLQLETTPSPSPSSLAPLGQCLLAAAPLLRTSPRSVMPLLLSLVFLALGIACLTVLYLIVRTHRQDTKHEAWLRHQTVSPLLALCWRLRGRRGRPALFLEDAEDDSV